MAVVVGGAPRSSVRDQLRDPALRTLGEVLAASLVMAMIVAATVHLGREADAPYSYDGQLNTETHVATMLVAFWYVVLLARVVRAAPGGRYLGLVVAVAGAIGPLALTASPAFGHDDLSLGLASFVWPWAVAALEAIVIIAAAAWLGRGGPREGTASTSEPASSRGVSRFGPLLAVTVSLAAVATVQLLGPDPLTDPGHGPLQVTVVLGWVVLAVATMAVCLGPLPTLIRIALSVLPSALVAAMYFAYNSAGGRPDVPGWEGAGAPPFTTVAIAVVVVAAPIVGSALRGIVLIGTRRWGRRTPLTSSAASGA